MGKDKLLHERKAYTFMQLLGDFGGFNGSIMMISGFLMSFYSSAMFKDSISKEIPVQSDTPSHKVRQHIRNLRQKFSREVEPPSLD